jgi:AAA domain
MSTLHAPAPSPTPPAPAGPPSRRPSLAAVTGGTRRLPTRLFVYAHEKWGKTSLAAFAPRPVFLMTRGETGLETLLAAGRLPATDHFRDPAADWADVRHAVRVLTDEEHSFGTLVLDTANGAERLCLEAVCREQFDNSWPAFDAYGRGVSAAQGEWVKLLDALDRLREARRMAVILLAHARVQAFRNPAGNDYDRYQPDLTRPVWSVTHKWADVIAFGSFQTHEKPTGEKGKVKATGGQQRVLHLERSAAWDAGNRYGLPAALGCGGGAQVAWDALAKALAACTARGVKPVADANGAA